MQEVLKIVKDYKILGRLFWITFFVSILAEWLLLLSPQIIKNMVHILEIKWEFNNLLFWWIIWFWLIVIVSILWYFMDILLSKLWAEIYYKKSQKYRKILLSKNYSTIINEWTWKLISRFSRWVEAEADIFTSVLQISTEAIFKLIIVIIIFSLLLPWFLVLLFVFIFSVYIINSLIIVKIRKYTEEENAVYEESSRILVKMISEYLTIKIFNKTNDELSKSEKILKRHPFYRMKITKYHTILFMSLFFFIKTLETLAYLYIWYYIIQWQFSIAFLVMITWYLWTLWNPINVAIKRINMISRQLQAYKKLQDFLDIPNKITDWTKKYEYQNGKIEIKNLYFGYSNKKIILKNLNLEFLAWKKNALVGHSWWWKSTIIKLLLRLYDYQKGEILIDEQKLKEIKIETFYDKIWYLPQEPWIFDGTIRENLEYAFENMDKYDESKIWEALKKAQIDDMIRGLDKWLDTEIWEKWVKLSWWEKQRLAIARIFLKDPKIVILDEPTSALDSISENKITKALDELTKWRTSIVIAHRLQTVIHSDKIIVLENGQVQAEWKHSELIKKSWIYKTLVDLQNGKIEE
jgi:ABC-type multidrug transport system fused ATPase/permease subunit